MARYIDADSFIDYLENKSYTIATIKTIKDFPTADVEEVVRCKDCKNYCQSGQCLFTRENMSGTEYCSRGEKK